MIGVDILCQAKSGMGKTAVFVLTTLHQLPEDPKPCSALILCHNRELAYQIKKEFQDIVLSARQDAFYARNMYANFGDIGVAVKVRAEPCLKVSASKP